jgi:hypothetical protein
VKRTSAASPRCDVLNLEWGSTHRDREVASLICRALRRDGLEVIEESFFRFRTLIPRLRPRVLYVGDPRGFPQTRQAAELAVSMGIPVVSIAAEGNLNPRSVRSDESYVWGYNHDRTLCEDISFQWSVRARDLFLSVAPELRSKLVVSGAVGFDRYRIFDYAEEGRKLREQLGVSGPVVGYAGWTFDRLFATDPLAVQFRAVTPDDHIEQFKRDREGIRDILGELITANRDVTFLLKSHPVSWAPEWREVGGLESEPNVVMVHTEIPISTCIGASDLWTAFESTTVLEAWLLDKPTAHINPTGVDLRRDELWRGSQVVTTAAEAQEAVATAREGDMTPEFVAAHDERRRIVPGVMQWDDGKNHLRAAWYIRRLVDRHAAGSGPQPLRNRLLGLRDRAYFGGARVAPRLPRLRGYAEWARRFSEQEMSERARRFGPAIDAFDEGNPLSAADISELEEINRQSAAAGNGTPHTLDHDPAPARG